MRGYDAYGWEGRQQDPRWGGEWQRGRFGGPGQPGPRGRSDRYDRGVYGDEYPGFDGSPRRSYDGGYGGGYGRPSVQRSRGGYGGEYDGGWRGGYARGPFLPEQAYQRHPELAQEPHRGPRHGYELDDTDFDLSDGEILRGVRSRLYEDVWLDVDRIDVAVEDGVVTLSGEVDDFLEARYAWDDAWETAGVRGVVNQLRVRLDRATQAHGDLLPQHTQGTSTEPGA